MLTNNVPWPKEMENTGDIGITADLQCGGWSTTMLNSKGILYNVGTMDGQNYTSTDPILSPLKYPPGYPQPTERYDPYVAIRQFSSGRQHVLGVADSGTIWSWYDERKIGLHIKFLHHDIVESGSSSPSSTGHGHVRSVVAGWDKSSAYISDIGIVLWEPIRGGTPVHIELDTMLINNTAVVPGTSYVRPRGSARDTDPESHQLGETVGEVTSYILLEHYVLFTTDTHRLFCARVTFNTDFLDAPDILELLPLQRASNEDSTPCITDVHGSFRSFAVLKSTGEVLTAKQEYLDACWAFAFEGPLALGSLADLPYSNGDPIPPPVQGGTADEHAPFRGHIFRIPALQNAGVIALAFGDYHFHALHSSGAITSYGTEPHASGALGLGTCSPSANEIAEGTLRGIKTQGFSRDGKLVAAAETTGRQVWFQPEKEEWLKFLSKGGADQNEARGRVEAVVREESVQAEVSEWVEKKGRAWDEMPELAQENEDGLGAYFALSVAAAGWHSGALVLVNDKLVKRIGESVVLEDLAVKEREPEGPEPQVSEDPATSVPGEGEGAAADQGTLNFNFSTVMNVLQNFGRSFLGLPPVVDPNAPQAPPSQATEQETRFSNPFASPEPGYRYKWAEDSFPRLRLSDGREMPGSVEFDESF